MGCKAAIRPRRLLHLGISLRPLATKLLVADFRCIIYFVLHIVWNRNPASDSVQVDYTSGDKLLATDVRFVFLRVDPHQQEIRAVVILSPEYIEERFGKFGKPTIKHQLLISHRMRSRIVSANPPILFYEDTPRLSSVVTSRFISPTGSIHDTPNQTSLLSLHVIRERVAYKLIGTQIPGNSTKLRGQTLEGIVANLLGYNPASHELLAGGYPDLFNQLLEVKIQDSPTVDLGMYTPQFEEVLPKYPSASTTDVRYLIALMDGATETVTGIVLSPGGYLGSEFSYVAGKSYKSQRAIPMRFFEAFDGQVVFNPPY